MVRLEAAALFAGVLVAACSIVVAAQDAAKPAGAPTFKTKCVSCHGVDGSGNTPVGRSLKVADLSAAEVQKKSDDQLVQVISDGKGNMPSFKDGTSQDEIRALVAHIRTLAKK